MKKMTKKISLLLIICALIAPSWNVCATSEVSGEGPTTEEKPTTLSDDATLGELSVEGVDLNKAFDPTTFEYKAVVGGDVDSVKITANPNSVLAKLDASSQIGTQQLEIGDNTFKIKVIAENKKEFEYKITITRAQSDLNLTKLNIQGQKLNEVFDPEVTEYTADVTYNVTSITIQNGRPVGTTVTVSGNSNLKVGKNTVTVTVKNAVGDAKEYKIIVTRGEEENIEEEDDLTTSEEVTTSDIVTSEDNTTVSDDVIEDKTDSNNTLRSVIVITSTVLLLLIAGLGIYFYVRTGNSEKKRQKKIEKLKRKQAKIEEQLTGLMPVITEEQEKDYLNNNSDDDSKTEFLEEEFLEDEEFESTIEIEMNNEVEEQPKKRRVDKTIFDDLDDLFDDRDE